MDIFLARQPIYDLNNNAVAYELLHRSSKENKFSFDVGADEATMKLLSNSYVIGFKELVNDKLAFINFSNDLILREIPSILPKNKIVVEILETVTPDNDVMIVLKKLKQQGYVLALDDVVRKSEFWKYGNLIDIYKIDFRATTREERINLFVEIKAFNDSAMLLAEKIETEEEYVEAKELGCVYFQGYYFSKPIMVKGNDIPIRNATCFQILSELLNVDYNVNKVEAIIKSDVAISYKIIKMLNSASFGFVQKISSIKQAIMLIGKKELSKWLTIIAMSEMESSNDVEVTRSLIVRGRFCELVAKESQEYMASQCFLAGLFSDLDKYMQKDMSQVVGDLPVEQELKEALLGKENYIYNVLSLARAYENVDEFDILKYSSLVGISKNKLAEVYLHSIDWENNLEKIIE